MTKLLTTTAVILAVFAAMPAQAATSGKGLTSGNLVRVALVKKVVIKKDLIRTRGSSSRRQSALRPKKRRLLLSSLSDV